MPTTQPTSEITSLNLIRYWRASLADASLGKGRLTISENNKLLKMSGAACQSGVLDEDMTAQIVNNHRLKAGGFRLRLKAGSVRPSADSGRAKIVVGV